MDPDPEYQVNPDPGFWWPKTEEKNTTEIFFIFFDQKMQFTYVQATGEVFSPQKRTSSTSKNEYYYIFSMFVGHFYPPGSGSGLRTGSWYGSRDPIESGSNPDPDTDWDPAPKRCFLQKASGQIFKDDVKGFSSTSNIYFKLDPLFKVKRFPEALIWSRQYTIAFYDKLKFRIKEFKSRFGISSKTDRKATKART